MTAEQRQNDTPIGGTEEFRGNMLSGDYALDDFPVYDGQKFVASSSVGLARAFGGIADNTGRSVAMNDALITGWSDQQPLNGTPLNVTNNPTAGLLTVALPGVYDVSFVLDGSGFADGVLYNFQMALNGAPTTITCTVDGSNAVGTQSTGFKFLAQLDAGDALGIWGVGNANSFNVINMALTIKRV